MSRAVATMAKPPAAPAAPQSVREVIQTPGEPLEAKTRATLEKRLGHDFSRVRVHRDPRAAASAREVEAAAYAVGSHVVFGAGEYRPETARGAALVAHELAHVAQQRGAADPGDALRVGPAGDAAEREAWAHAQGRAPPGVRERVPEARVQRVSLWEHIRRFFGGGTFADEELLTYLDFLRQGAIEDDFESDNKARAIVARWREGDVRFTLTPALKALLIQEMLSGYVADDDEEAVLALLGGTGPAERAQVLSQAGEARIRSGLDAPSRPAFDALAREARSAQGRARSTATFDPEAVAQMRQRFTENSLLQSRQNCIQIIRALIPRLYGHDPALAQRVEAGAQAITRDRLTHTMTGFGRMMADLGLVSAQTRITFDPDNGHSRPTRMRASAWDWIVGQLGQDHGWHVFGLAPFNGYHSVAIFVDHRPNGTFLYWADQWNLNPPADLGQAPGSAHGFRRYTRQGLDGFITSFTASRWQHVFDESNGRRRYEATCHIWKFRSGLERSSAPARRPARPKLRWGRPSDPEEDRADRHAEAVAGAPPSRAREGPRVPWRAPEVDAGAVESRGEPLPADVRADLAPHYAFDLAGVRVRRDAEGGAMADAMGARAFAVGRTIVFGPGEFAPHAPEGRSLLAHELAHVGEARPGVARAAVSARLPEIRDRLTYGVLDWAVTDEDARVALDILSRIPVASLEDTIRALDAEGLAERLIDNVPAAEAARHQGLLRVIERARRSNRDLRQIVSLLSYGALDWVVTDREARVALEALQSLERRPDQLRNVMVSIPQLQWDRLLENLTPADVRRSLRFLQLAETIRVSGMSVAQMAQAQATHLGAQAAGRGVSVGTEVHRVTQAGGYGGNPVTPLTQAQRNALRQRLDAVLPRIRAQAPEEVRLLLRAAEAQRGGIRVDQERAQELGAYAFQDGPWLVVGQDWIRRAEADPRDVFDNILHELGGHHEYGPTLAWRIMEGALASLPADERAIANRGPRRVSSAYGYMETEMYSELRELELRRPGSGGDDPRRNVGELLEAIRDRYEPRVAEALVRGFRRRVQLDTRIVPAARQLLDQEIQRVFRIRLEAP